MKKIILIICLLPIFAFSQVSYKIIADSTILKSISTNSNELVIRNSTKDTIGVLYNNGSGVTQFKKVRSIKLNDSTYVIKIGTSVIGDTIKTASAGGLGTVTSVSGTSPISVANGTSTPVISIANSAADGSTKGAASFTANDFNSSSGNISIDYTNGQASSGSTKGFLSAADWTTFNGKQASGSYAVTTNNLSDLGSASTARTNLGLGTAAVQNTSAFLQPSNNLSDVSSASTARSNLGLGTASTQATGAFFQISNNLSDGTASTMRTNLGGTTIGISMFTLTNPSAVTFPRFNADNTITARTASQLKSDLAITPTDLSGLGTGVATNLAQTRAFQTLTDAATVTYNITNGYNAKVTLGGNRTLSITNAAAGDYGTLIVTQDATGSRTLTLPAGSKVISGGGGAITLTTTASATDILSWFYDGTNYFWTYGKNYN